MCAAFRVIINLCVPFRVNAKDDTEKQIDIGKKYNQFESECRATKFHIKCSHVDRENGSNPYLSHFVVIECTVHYALTTRCLHIFRRVATI